MQQNDTKEIQERHEWVRKEIHCELCKKLKFHHTNKRYRDKPEVALENETHYNNNNNTAACNSNVNRKNLGININIAIKKSRKQKWEEKQLYRSSRQQTKEIAHEIPKTWL